MILSQYLWWFDQRTLDWSVSYFDLIEERSSNHGKTEYFFVWSKRNWPLRPPWQKFWQKLSRAQRLHDFLREVAISNKGTPLNERHYVQRALAWSRKTRHLAFQRWILSFLGWNPYNLHSIGLSRSAEMTRARAFEYILYFSHRWFWLNVFTLIWSCFEHIFTLQ